MRFDLSFLQAAATGGYPRLTNRVVDTCALARRLVRDEVPNCRLATLAEHLRLAHRPSHRALDDALTTADRLHALLERAGSLGVLGLDDLLELPTIRAHPQGGKLRLTASLPRRPGVYLFRGLGGRVLYVGKAAELRSRVRSYFSGDERRKIGQLLWARCRRTPSPARWPTPSSRLCPFAAAPSAPAGWRETGRAARPSWAWLRAPARER